MPWLDANAISIRYQLAGNGPSVVLLHEMGGTLDSWDGIAPALSEKFRVLRYDQRGSGLTEKVRQPITTEQLVDDLAAAQRLGELPPPFHFVTLAAATMQPLIYITPHSDRIACLTFCNPCTRAAPSRLAAPNERAALAAREGLRAIRPRSTIRGRPTSATPRPTRPIAGAYMAHDPSCLPRSIARSRSPTSRNSARTSTSRPWWCRPVRQGAPAATSEQFAKIIPGARFELIDAVHMMPAQAPGPLLALLKDFLGAQIGSTAKA